MQEAFWQQMQERVSRYDLLCHPFYQAWTEGTLTRQDLARYAAQYYPHVEAFPGYLQMLADRLPEGALKSSVLENRDDELGNGLPSHAELWLDFAEGMGAGRNPEESVPEVAGLVEHMRHTASSGTPAEALAAFWAYESQVPRVAEQKDRGLREMYGADEATRRYFTLHTTADVAHSQVWREQLSALLAADPGQSEAALATAETTAAKLWSALDGIERVRQAELAA